MNSWRVEYRGRRHSIGPPLILVGRSSLCSRNQRSACRTLPSSATLSMASVIAAGRPLDHLMNANGSPQPRDATNRQWPSRRRLQTCGSCGVEFYNPRRRHSSISYLSPMDCERRHQPTAADPDARQPAAVLAAVKDKPSGRPQRRPSLTAAARDGRTIVRVGTEEWLRRGRTKEWLDTGGQHAVTSDRLIPSTQPSTKPG